MIEVPLPVRKDGPEWTLLELLCPGPLDGARRDLFLDIIRHGKVDYGRLVEDALRHRMHLMLAYEFNDDELSGLVPAQLSGELLGILLANRRRVAVLTRTAEEVAEHLGRAGVAVAATKGVVLEPTIYGGLGLRKMMDVDFVIHPDSRTDVTRLMAEIGFVNGVYRWREHRIADLPPRTRAMYRLSPDHLPHYRRLDADGAGVLTVDFANSLTWAASSWQLDMSEVLASRREVSALAGAVRLPALGPTHLFLSVALHLFRESWFSETIERGKDMLYKFADVLRLWAAHHAIVLAELPDLIERYDLARPVGWVLTHTDRTFGTDMAERLGLAAAMSEEWLASARGAGGSELVWHGSMQDRLRAHDRSALFRPGERPAPPRTPVG